MKCKHCQAELPPESEFCPKCGASQAGKSPYQQSGKASPGKIALAVAAVVVLAALFTVLILSGLGFFDADTNPTGTSESTEPSDTQSPVSGTIPADTGLNDPTCKGTYTVSDDAAAAAMDTVVATMGDRTLTNGELQAYYWFRVRMFLDEYYYYISMLGLDLTQPLDTQVCVVDETLTWQQYFLSDALNMWQTYGSLDCAAEAAGFELSEEDQAYLDGLKESLEQDALDQGYETSEDMVRGFLGAGTNLDYYLKYENVYFRAWTYYNSPSTLEFTDEDIEAFFDEHAAEYEENGLTKETCTVDVRHILVLPEGATIDTIYTDTFSDEAWAVGEQNAQAILDQWLADEDRSEETFAALANEKSADPGSNTNGGLYTDVSQGQMVEAFDAWCFDESRQVGDYAIVKTELGYHVMYFSGSTLIWPQQAATDMITKMSNDLLDEALATYPMEVDYKAIVLGFVDLAA